MSTPNKRNARLIPRTQGVAIGPLRLTAKSAVAFSADVQDLSIMGVGLVGELEYPAGSCFVVEGGPKGKALPQELIAELRHATQRPDGRWLLGCSFSRHLTLNDLDAMS